MSQRIIQVDAFTNQPFQGNPAAVCVLSDVQTDDWMQQVAHEMNLSETAFLIQHRDGFKLRWFTPETEVDLCGHATLASAHVLWSEGHLEPDQDATFFTRSGTLSAHSSGDWIDLDFPAATLQQTPLSAEVSKALHVSSSLAYAYIDQHNGYLLIEVESEERIRQISPDFATLKSAPFSGIIVTSPSEKKVYDFVSRFFAPALGVDEDPVTGSAHCSLAPFWRDRLGKDDSSCLSSIKARWCCSNAL